MKKELKLMGRMKRESGRGGIVDVLSPSWGLRAWEKLFKPVDTHQLLATPEAPTESCGSEREQWTWKIALAGEWYRFGCSAREGN